MPRNPFFGVVRWILVTQFLVTLVTGSAFVIMAGSAAGQSALLGGLAAFLPNLYFGLMFGVKNPGRSARQVVRAFYSGEAVKLLLTAALLAMVFQLSDLRYFPLFTGFVLVTGVFWFALLVRGTKL